MMVPNEIDPTNTRNGFPFRVRRETKPSWGINLPSKEPPDSVSSSKCEYFRPSFDRHELRKQPLLNLLGHHQRYRHSCHHTFWFSWSSKCFIISICVSHSRFLLSFDTLIILLPKNTQKITLF